jgi:hypothetical protein
LEVLGEYERKQMKISREKSANLMKEKSKMYRESLKNPGKAIS